jgi:hypothetical protein
VSAAAPPVGDCRGPGCGGWGHSPFDLEDLPQLCRVGLTRLDPGQSLAHEAPAFAPRLGRHWRGVGLDEVEKLQGDLLRERQ